MDASPNDPMSTLGGMAEEGCHEFVEVFPEEIGFKWLCRFTAVTAEQIDDVCCFGLCNLDWAIKCLAATIQLPAPRRIRCDSAQRNAASQLRAEGSD